LDQLDAGISLRDAADWLNSEAQKIYPEKSLTHAGLRLIRGVVRPNYIKSQRGAKPKKIRMTREERTVYRMKQKIKGEKVSISAAKRRIKKIEEEINPVTMVIEEPKVIDYDFSQAPISTYEQNVIFTPNPGPQT